MRLLSQPRLSERILGLILSSNIAKSYTGKVFIVNIIFEIAATSYTRELYYPLVYVYHCVFLVSLSYILEKVGWIG